MTKFESETYRVYSDDNGNRITLKEFIANQINSSWIYSAHWNDETWVHQARNDCLYRIDSAKKDLESLHTALKEIEKLMHNEALTGIEGVRNEID